MAKTTLPTNYKDDILNSSMGGKRRYKQTTNADGTVSLEDASTYDQVGSNFGASQLNAISKAVNQSADSSKIISDPDTASATTQKGYIADVQLFNHINDSLQNLGVGIGSIIQTATTFTSNFKYTANENCYIYLYVGVQANGHCTANISNSYGEFIGTVMRLYSNSSVVQTGQTIPLLKGQSINVVLVNADGHYSVNKQSH